MSAKSATGSPPFDRSVAAFRFFSYKSARCESLLADPLLPGQQAIQRLEREQPGLYGGSLQTLQHRMSLDRAILKALPSIANPPHLAS